MIRPPDVMRAMIGKFPHPWIEVTDEAGRAHAKGPVEWGRSISFDVAPGWWGLQLLGSETGPVLYVWSPVLVAEGRRVGIGKLEGFVLTPTVV